MVESFDDNKIQAKKCFKDNKEQATFSAISNPFETFANQKANDDRLPGQYFYSFFFIIIDNVLN